VLQVILPAPLSSIYLQAIMIVRPAALALRIRSEHDNLSLPNLPSLRSPTRKERLQANDSTPPNTPASLYWKKTVGVHLDGLMEDAFYTASARQRFAVIFQTHIVPFMGEPPHRQRMLYGSQAWPSFMTDDHTPIEYGLAWKGRAKTVSMNGEAIAPPQVRFSIEAIDTSEVMRYGTNRSASLRIVSSLASAGLLDASLFHTLYDKICIEAHKDRNQRGSEIFLGFDILPSGSVSVKAYFVLQHGNESSSSEDLVINCLSRLDHQMHSKAADSWTNRCGYDRIIQQLDSVDFKKRGRPVLLSVDLVKPQDSRCKLYWRFPHVIMAKEAASYLELNHVPSSWQGSLENVLSIFDEEKSSLPCSSKHPTGGLLVYYDLATPQISPLSQGVDRTPNSKAYLPVRLFDDNKQGPTKTDKIALLLQEQYHTSFDYISAVGKVSSALDANDPHTYLCMERKGKSLIFSTYIKPTLAEL
jgi:DMATS type aromatic prenyltransferase